MQCSRRVGSRVTAHCRRSAVFNAPTDKADACFHSVKRRSLRVAGIFGRHAALAAQVFGFANRRSTALCKRVSSRPLRHMMCRRVVPSACEFCLLSYNCRRLLLR